MRSSQKIHQWLAAFAFGRGLRATLLAFAAASLHLAPTPALAGCVIEWPIPLFCHLDTKGTASVSCPAPSLKYHKFTGSTHIYFFKGQCVVSTGDAVTNVWYTVDGMWNGANVQEITKFTNLGNVKVNANCGGPDPWLENVSCSAQVTKSADADSSYNSQDLVQGYWATSPYPRTANALSAAQKQQLIAEAKAQPVVVKAYTPIIVSPSNDAAVAANQAFDVRVQASPLYGLGWQFIYYQDATNPTLEPIKPISTVTQGEYKFATFKIAKKGLWLYRTQSLSLPPSDWSAFQNIIVQ